MLGLTELQAFVHRLEELFRSATDAWPQSRLDLMFAAAAALRVAVDAAATDASDAATSRLRQLRVELEAAPVATAPAPSSSPSPPPRPAAPDAAGPESEPAHHAADGVADAADRGAGAADADAEGSPAPLRDPGGEVLRIPFSKLDELLGQVGELIVASTLLDDELTTHRAALEALGIRRALIDRAAAIAGSAAQLRDLALDLRLVPVARAFERFPGLARDLARRNGKRVRVRLEGEQTELDKSTVDALAEPLLHLVRNAVDHGIEPPAEREAAGKPAEGLLVLRAIQRGDHVRIEVEDDGSGIDETAILERARDVGLVGEDEQPSPDEVRELIFRSGFSTRLEATLVSGRGVGLDAVRRRMQEIRGALAVEPAPGGGTRFVLDLPLTLAIVPAIVFETADEPLSLPVYEIEETLRRPAIEHLGATEVVRYHDELVPLARLDRLFGWTAPEAEPAQPRFAIVIRRGARVAAVAADRMIDQRDVVVKALPEYLGNVPGISGGSVAPDGRVVLLLDANGLLDLNLDFHRRVRRAGPAS
jgi:two-component system, chemotaxis family, sensor kinase CheA